MPGSEVDRQAWLIVYHDTKPEDFGPAKVVLLATDAEDALRRWLVDENVNEDIEARLARSVVSIEPLGDRIVHEYEP